MFAPAPSPDRIVRRARLRVPGPDAVPGFRFLVEDALNTASLPTTRGLLVVRRLSLGRLPHGAGRLACAQRVQEALARAAETAAHGGAPGARVADAIWFRGADEAALGLLAELTGGRATDAWYWPGALPQAPADATAGLAAHLVARLLAHPAGLASLGRFLARLPEADIARFLRLLPASPPVEVVEKSPSLAGGRAFGPIRSPPQPRGRLDHRDGLLLDLRVTRGALLARAISPLDWRARLVATAELAARGHPPESWAVASACDALAALVPMVSAPMAADAEDHAATADAITPEEADRSFTPERRPTARGGLLMLVNILHALGFPDWLERQPPEARAPLGRALLRLLGRLPPDDPHRALLALSPLERRALADVRCRAGDFRLPGWCPARLPADPVRAREAVRGWRRAVHAACRARLGLTAPSIVRRDARLSLGLTHADVIFRLAQADAGLRRAGLDQDPGWTPWLGYIVSFHFAAEAE